MPNIGDCRLGGACRIDSETLSNNDSLIHNGDDCLEISCEYIKTRKCSTNTFEQDELTTEISAISNCVDSPIHSVAKDDNLKTDGIHNGSIDAFPLNEIADTPKCIQSSWLFRLFKSSLFNMDLALQYLYKSEDAYIQSYLVHRLYDFDSADVDFYLLQLVSLFQINSRLAEYLHPYFVHRCSQSVSFAIHLIWLLDAFAPRHEDVCGNTLTYAHLQPSSAPLLHSSKPSKTGNMKDEDDESKKKGKTFSGQSLRQMLLPSDSRIWSYFGGCTLNKIQSSFYSRLSINRSNNSDREFVPSHGNEASHSLTNTLNHAPMDGLHKRTVSDITGLFAHHSMQFNPIVDGTVYRSNDSSSSSSDSRQEAANNLRLVEHSTACLSIQNSQNVAVVPTASHPSSPISSFSSQSQSSSKMLETTNRNLRTASLNKIECPNLNTTNIYSKSSTFICSKPNDAVCAVNASQSAFRLNCSSSVHSLDDMIHLTAAKSESKPTDVDSLDLQSSDTAPVILQGNSLVEFNSLQTFLIPRLIPEWDFADGLLRIARRLVPIPSKEHRTAHLQAELGNLNLHLPARVWLPVANQPDHIVLRIPPTAAVCLNSKDKAPFLIYVEILSCTEDLASVSLPQRPLNISSQASRKTTVFGWNSKSTLQSNGWSTVNNNSHSFGYEPCPDTSPSSGNPFGETGRMPMYITAGEVRNRLKEQAEEHQQPHRSFKSDPDDPSAAVLKEPWQTKCDRIRATSPWGSLSGWRLTSAIVKVGDDLRQEQLAYQLLSVLKNIWHQEFVPLWLRPLTVVVTSPDSGFIEPVPDTVSLHQIRRHAKLSLLDYMLREHGPSNSEAFLTAQRNFVQSCAAYCLVGYLLQVKDRHNGNILLDNEGHVIHIDYGFILTASPGKNFGFETSPFKLTIDQVAVMGGLGSDLFEYFKILLLRGLLAARKHMEQICILVEIARSSCAQLPCFARAKASVELKQRFLLNRTEDQIKQLVDQMVAQSLNSVTTKLYDSFQYYTNGIQ